MRLIARSTSVLCSAVLAAGLASCSDGDLYCAPEFEHEYEAEFEVIGGELLCFPYQIAVDGNWLLVFGKTADNNTVTVYDKNTGKELKSGIKYGRGLMRLLADSAVSLSSEIPSITTSCPAMVV